MHRRKKGKDEAAKEEKARAARVAKVKRLATPRRRKLGNATASAKQDTGSQTVTGRKREEKGTRKVAAVDQSGGMGLSQAPHAVAQTPLKTTDLHHVAVVKAQQQLQQQMP